MTGKQLKEFAAQVHDDAVIEIRRETYHSWEPAFEMQAPYVYKGQKKSTDEAAKETAE